VEPSPVAAGDQRLAMFFALQHRQAIVMRADAAGKMALRFHSRWCAVMVAPILAGAARDEFAASAVVMCSNTMRSAGKSRQRLHQVAFDEHRARGRTRRPSLSVTSPCTSSGRPCCSIAASVAAPAASSGDAGSELVVAPAG
jgi:hypothetical protein